MLGGTRNKSLVTAMVGSFPREPLHKLIDSCTVERGRSADAEAG